MISGWINLPVPVQFMLCDLTIQGVAVDAQHLGGLGLISTRLGQGSLDESFLELAYGFSEINLSFDHFRYKGLQLLFHSFFLRVGLVLLIVGYCCCRHHRSSVR